MPTFDTAAAMAKSVAAALVKYSILVILLVWLFCETLFAAPYFLSYFNELGSSIWNGYHYVTDSNYDWGQDSCGSRHGSLRIPKWIKSRWIISAAAIRNIISATKEVDWSSSKGNPSAQGIHWLVVSINTLEIATQPLENGQSRSLSDSYSWLAALRAAAPGMGNVPPPDFRVGTSLFVYHL